MKRTLLVILLLTPLFFISGVQANQGDITLLTVGESTNGNTVGGTANLHLRIEEGDGRIFIDSFPLTRVDTQISTRFSKDIACEFTGVNCDNYDFYYTIDAESSVVGGPSAGSAMTVLTTAVLEGHSVDDDAAMTGTINSGGMIGPVSGVAAKVEAAERQGYETVVIPKWDLQMENGTEPIDTTSIEIVRVGVLEEAIEAVTGETYSRESGPVTPSEEYQRIMQDVANDLCTRYDNFSENISNTSSLNESKEARRNANESIEERDYYSAASYCFNANTNIQAIRFENLTVDEKARRADDLEVEANQSLQEIDDRSIDTVSDLETKIIVKERLRETIELLNDPIERTAQLGYINERYQSALAWSRFFEYEGREVDMNQNHLRDACRAKINEAEERINYLELLMGDQEDLKEDLEQTKDIYRDGDYAFCLFRASRNKADASAMLTSRALPDGQIGEFINDQLSIARYQINEQETDFPILGYSYYKFATSLVEDDPTSALIFSEYALEMSNLGMYFPSDEGKSIATTYLPEEARPYFLLGLFLGLGLSVGVFTYLLRKKKKRIVRKWRKRKGK